MPHCTFMLQETQTLTISFFEKRDLEWYNCSDEMSLFDKLILGACLLHTVFLSDVLSDVIGVINKCIGDDTKAAARQSLNCTKKNKIWRKTIFNMVDGILTPCNVTGVSGMT